ncbi:hypothetical protein ALC53_07878 [Atta colombica]|uniref:Uncharacterized protein n=1 Tax=Atta colombica TaxID=520822 RepID=A0A195BBZ3_9HYME|nr:hypothetical protein ALC53_07878 [Atta colombica]
MTLTYRATWGGGKERGRGERERERCRRTCRGIGKKPAATKRCPAFEKPLMQVTPLMGLRCFLKTYRITAHYDAQSYGASLKSFYGKYRNTRSRDIVFLKRACTLDQQRCSLTVIVLYMSSQCALLLTLFQLGSVPTSNCYQTFYKFTFFQKKERFNPTVLVKGAANHVLVLFFIIIETAFCLSFCTISRVDFSLPFIYVTFLHFSNGHSRAMIVRSDGNATMQYLSVTTSHRISSLRTSFFLSDIRSVDVHDEEHVNPKEVGRLHPAPSQSKEVEETPGTFTTTSDAYPLHHRTLATVNRENFLNSHIPER